MGQCNFYAKCWWFMLVILASWGAEISRTTVHSQPEQIVHKTPISKITRAKWCGSSSKAPALQV
jgi:hypothetical protein